MKNILIIASLLFLISCNTKKEKVYTLEEQEMIDSIADALMDNANKTLWEKSKTTDTIGVYLAPVKVLKAELIESESARYRNVRLKYQNVSDKKIVAIRFRWKGENAFFEPADMGSSFTDGYGGGFDDDPMSPNEIEFSTWEILSRNAKTIEAWPIQVVFSDSTKWSLN